MSKNTFDWKKAWIGTPEFIQEKQTPHAQIIIRFENEEDLQDFAIKIGQKLTILSRNSKGEGFLPRENCKMLEDMHPDVAKVVWKFNRWRHSVDYKLFRNNAQILKKILTFPPE